MTGDWFYDQRFNRFSAAPGHGLVSYSLKRRSQCVSSKEEVVVASIQECKLPSNFPIITHQQLVNFDVHGIYFLAAMIQVAVEEEPLKNSNVNPVQAPAPLPRAKLRSLINHKALVFPLYTRIFFLSLSCCLHIFHRYWTYV